MTTHAEIRKVSYEAWIAEAKKKFGEDAMNWTFICPVCKHVQSVKDYKNAGAPSSAAGFSCVGRWVEGSKEAFDKNGTGPCNYAGGGLFRLSPVRVKMDDGEVIEAFEWAELRDGEP